MLAILTKEAIENSADSAAILLENCLDCIGIQVESEIIQYAKVNSGF
jgi:hypothetical protein